MAIGEIEKNVSFFILASGSSTVVIQLTHDPKFAGLNLAATGIVRKLRKKASILILGSGSSTVVEKMTHDLKFAGLNLAATGIVKK